MMGKEENRTRTKEKQPRYEDDACMHKRQMREQNGEGRARRRIGRKKHTMHHESPNPSVTTVKKRRSKNKENESDNK